MADDSGQPPPVIEYCGGTEIGGGYITGTVTRPCVPGTFNTPALGLDVVILDENRQPADKGELKIMPPSIGMSTTLLNKDHHEVYYADVPAGPRADLRRHGDQMERLAGGYGGAHGRADDTMNLRRDQSQFRGNRAGGANRAESDRGRRHCRLAADGGPSQLVIYAVCSDAQTVDKDELQIAMQNAIKRDLNPLFKIHDVVLVAALPRTASNKVMRRTLREKYRGCIMTNPKRNILITGAGSGSGRGLALCLAGKGTRSSPRIAISPPGKRRREIRGGQGGGACLDVTSEEGIAAFLLAIGDRRIEVLINNAGVQHVAPVEEYPPAKWDLLMDVIVRGTFLMTRAVLPLMRAGGFGRIINIGSIHALIASPYKSAYIAAKHALVGFAKGVALETGGTDITINTICPSYIRTPLVEPQIKVLAARGKFPKRKSSSGSCWSRCPRRHSSRRRNRRGGGVPDEPPGS